MTITDRTTAATKRVPMDSLRKTALVAGLLYLVTFISIPSLALYVPVHDPGYILGPGPDTGVLWGGLLEVIVALTGIGTAIVLYPVVKRQNESLALGFVATRVLEAALIFVGVATLLAVVTLRQDLAGAAGADAASLVTTGTALVGFQDWVTLLGQGLIPGLNALLLGTLMYRSRLVPRAIPLMGLIGAPLLLASATAVMFGIIGPLSGWRVITVLPVALWELSLGVWLVVKGFKPSPITAGMTAASTPPAHRGGTV